MRSEREIAVLLCTHVLMMDGGRVLADGTPGELGRRFNAATLEDAFMLLTGKTFETEEETQESGEPMSFGRRHPELNALFGFAERQFHVVKRYWAWEIVWLFYSLVSGLSIGFLASGLGQLGAPSAAFDLHRAQLYLLIGALLWGYLSLVFMEAAYGIAWERWEGTIEYTFMAPVRRMTHPDGPLRLRDRLRTCADAGSC